ncbi:MAG: endonuclease NucS [Candidatus Micrarchaeia archaeon]
MKNYYRILLGSKNVYAKKAYEGRFVGIHFGLLEDLSKFPNDPKEFSKKCIPLILKKDPDRSKFYAAQASSMLWSLSKGMKIGDIVICPDSEGNYLIGEIVGDYEFHKDQILPHSRPVSWFSKKIPSKNVSDSLRKAIHLQRTIINLTSKYANEIEALISGDRPIRLFAMDTEVEDPLEFALEEHLEDFLVKNWKRLEIGKNYDIYEEKGELVGKEYQTDTGPIDILAISKDKKTLLVVELKKGRSSDTVVGQIQRYMGYVKDVLAEKDQNVKGAIIAAQEDKRIKRALSIVPNVDFYTYKLDFKLEKK